VRKQVCGKQVCGGVLNQTLRITRRKFCAQILFAPLGCLKLATPTKKEEGRRKKETKQVCDGGSTQALSLGVLQSKTPLRDTNV
jgi:hypothetical protein